jgi:5-methylcytosine-specific restriction endonuclease McrA
MGKLSPHPCTWCKGPVQSPRRRWCSDACVTEFKIRYHQAEFREFVWNNSDKRCALCRVRLEKLEELFKRARAAYQKNYLDPKESQRGERWLRRLVRRFPWAFNETVLNRYWVSLRHLWEADHIVPQALGGQDLDPRTNGRVLCRRCHSRKTADDIKTIRTRRAA